MLDLEQYQILGSTAREIAASTEAAIRQGRLETGAPLPTVRALAQRLGTSPATVNAGYRILRQRGLIVADGRRGTHVAPRPALRAPQPSESPEHLRDLATGLPDPTLLPPLHDALARVDVEAKLRMSRLDAGDPQLVGAARSWFEADGIPAQALAVVGGAFDGMERVLQSHLRPGDRVIIEDPVYPSIQDLLLALGLRAVPVPIDDSGPIAEPFAAALAKGVEAALIVPRAQNPAGAALDTERTGTLRALLQKRPDVLLIEDDHAGLVSGARFATLTGPERSRWAVIRSTSKILHPDLRLALMAGDSTTIARVEGRQAIGTRWVSHLLQAVVSELLRDPAFAPRTARAREAYAGRRDALVAAFAAHEIVALGRSGLNVWVPVREESPAVRALFDAGWLVLPGERFRTATPPGIRITIAAIKDDEAGEIARVLAGVEHAGRPRRVY